MAILNFTDLDHSERQRVEIWGEATLVEDDRELLESLMPPGSAIHVTRAIRLRVLAWDISCPSHIPQLFTLEQVEAASAAMLARIAELEEQLARRAPSKSRRRDSAGDPAGG